MFELVLVHKNNIFDKLFRVLLKFLILYPYIYISYPYFSSTLIAIKILLHLNWAKERKFEHVKFEIII